MREANEGWAAFVARLVSSHYGGKQSALADAIGVSPSTVTRWIDGATPAIQQLRAISDTLGYRMAELLRAAGALDGDDSGEVSGAAGIIVDVTEAIRQDTGLLDEAKEHLLSQYALLLRLSPPEKARRGRPSPEDETIEERRERLRREHETRARRREGHAQQQDGGRRGMAAGGGSGGRLGGGGRGADR